MGTIEEEKESIVMPSRKTANLFGFSFHLDVLLFWAFFSASAIFILWLFNNTVKAQIRSSVEQRILSTSKSVALLLDPKIHLQAGDVYNLRDYFERIWPSVEAIKAENPDVEDILLANFQNGKLKLFQTDGQAEEIQNKDFLEEKVRQAQQSGKLALSNWKFLRDEIFFFFTPPATGHEFSFIAIAGWDDLPLEERPVAILLFNAEKVQSQLATVDVSSANVIGVAILLATVLSLALRRRNVQREEAIEQKLEAMQMLHQRDSILAAAVTSADRFIVEKNLTPPIRYLLHETAQVMQVDAAYFLTLPNPSSRRKHPHPIGIISDAHQTFDLGLLFRSEWRRWREKLEHGHPVAETISTLPPQEQLLLKKLSIESIAILPVAANHRFVAALIFENYQREIEWEGGLMTTLKLAANLLGSAMARQENETKLIQSSKMEALGRMAGGVAHEFNNLLHIVTGNLASLSKKLRGDEASLIDNIREASQRGSTIIDQLLRATRQTGIEFKPVSLNEIVERTVALVKPALSKSIELATKLEENLPLAPMDENLIQQVILNILLNAQYAVRESGKIIVKTGKVDKSRGSKQEMIFCSVRDSGPGIPQEIFDSIFAPFFTTKPPGTGTGLGLFTSRGILEQHKGSIEATNHPEGGAVFTFYLPVRKLAARVKESRETEVEAELPENEIILVADDEPLCLGLATDILREHGFQFITAVDGNDLLEKARQNHEKIDWVITDWTMPGPGGEELIRELRQILPKARLIVTSGFLIENTHKIDAVLRKPFQSDELVALIRKLNGAF